MKQYNFYINLGWNVSSSKDVGHKFDMQPFFDKYKNIYWAKNVKPDERVASTLYFESFTVIDSFVNKNNIDTNKVNVCFGRGAFGSITEKFMIDKMTMLNQKGIDTINVVIAKSFCVIDSLKAIDAMKEIDIDLFIAVDGVAPFWALGNSITRYKSSELVDDDKGQRERLNVFANIKNYYSIVQRKDFLKGYLWGNPNNPNSVEHNLVIEEFMIRNKVYDHYADGHKRSLKVSHNDMEEICSIVPCCFADNRYYTFPAMLYKFLDNNV